MIQIQVDFAEGWLSGLRRWSRKPVGTKVPRRFKSSTLRQENYMFNISSKNKKEPENLKGVLKRLEKLQKEQEDVIRDLADLKDKNRKNLQKLGIVRFNPFSEIGGEQSFSIALLDAQNDGFVITSQYGRETNRTYAKPVKNGQSSYTLSKEEQEAINKAINA